MRIDISKDWYPNVVGGEDPKAYTDVSVSEWGPVHKRLEQKAREELLAHFNHPAHNFGARIVEYGGISAGGRFPFNLTHFGTDGYFSEISLDFSYQVQKPFLFRLFSGEKVETKTQKVYVPTKVKGMITYQCEDPDPRELLDILRYAGYRAEIYRLAPSPQSNRCRCESEDYGDESTFW